LLCALELLLDDAQICPIAAVDENRNFPGAGEDIAHVAQFSLDTVGSVRMSTSRRSVVRGMIARMLVFVAFQSHGSVDRPLCLHDTCMMGDVADEGITTRVVAGPLLRGSPAHEVPSASSAVRTRLAVDNDS
jgi:hypothetical protein